MVDSSIAAYLTAGATVVAAIGGAVFVFITSPRTERTKAEATIKLESQRRLYTELHPLLFQLFEASELGFSAATGLVRRQKRGQLPKMLSTRNYDVLSLAYKTVLPLVYLRLVQRTAALTDLDTDELTKRRYRIRKQAFVTLTDDFGISDKFNLPYDPNNTETGEEAARFRQGVVVHHLERLADAMIVEKDKERRAMTFGEMEDLASSNVKFQKELAVLADLFQGFEFGARPVFGRVLIAYAAILHVLLRTYAPDAKLASAEELGAEYFHGTPLPLVQVIGWRRWLPRSQVGQYRVIPLKNRKRVNMGSCSPKPKESVEEILQTIENKNSHRKNPPPREVDVKPIQDINLVMLKEYVEIRLKQADKPWDYVRS